VKSDGQDQDAHEKKYYWPIIELPRNTQIYIIRYNTKKDKADNDALIQPFYLSIIQ